MFLVLSVIYHMCGLNIYFSAFQSFFINRQFIPVFQKNSIMFCVIQMSTLPRKIPFILWINFHFSHLLHIAIRITKQTKPFKSNGSQSRMNNSELFLAIHIHDIRVQHIPEITCSEILQNSRLHNQAVGQIKAQINCRHTV